MGEPIIAAAPELEAPDAGTGAAGGPLAAGGAAGFGGEGGTLGPGGAAGEGGAGGAPAQTDPFGGLCTSCATHEDCGDASDACLQSESGERFCGRDCDEWGGCPVGYDCVGIGDTAVPQCAPRTDTCIHLDFKPPLPDPAALRAEAIDFVNDLRAERGLYPLQVDDCLSQLAEQSAAELASTGDFLGKFERECLEQPSCECGWSGESESSISAYDLRYDDVFEQPILDRLQQSPEDFQGTLFSQEFTRVGYGMVLSGDEGFGAYSFGL